MAFTPGTLSLTVNGIGDGVLRRWVYLTFDSYASVIVAGYFDTAVAAASIIGLGLEIGDLIDVAIFTDPDSPSLLIPPFTLAVMTI